MPVSKWHFCTCLGCSFVKIHIHQTTDNCHKGRYLLSFLVFLTYKESYLPLKLDIPGENNDFHKRNDFPKQKTENPILRYSKIPRGIIFPVGFKYFL